MLKTTNSFGKIKNEKIISIMPDFLVALFTFLFIIVYINTNFISVFFLFK